MSASTSDRVKKILVQVREIPIAPEDLTEEQSLSAPEIGVDSLSLLELVVRLESEFDIHVCVNDSMPALP